MDEGMDDDMSDDGDEGGGAEAALLQDGARWRSKPNRPGSGEG